MVAKGKVLQEWAFHGSQTTLSTFQSPPKIKYHWVLFLQPAKTLVIWTFFYWAWEMQHQNGEYFLLFLFVFQPPHCFSGRQVFISASLSRTAPWKWKKTTQTSQERQGRCKGWEQGVLCLPFLVDWWWFEVGVSWLKCPFMWILHMASSILQHCFKQGWGKEIQIFVWPAASPVPLNRGAEHQKAEFRACQGLHCSKTQQELLQWIPLSRQWVLDGTAWLGNGNNCKHPQVFESFPNFPQVSVDGIAQKKNISSRGYHSFCCRGLGEANLCHPFGEGTTGVPKDKHSWNICKWHWKYL